MMAHCLAGLRQKRRQFWLRVLGKRNDAVQVSQHLLMQLHNFGQVAVDGGPEPGRKSWQRREYGNIDLGKLELR